MEKINFINSTFSPEEAKEILLDMIARKINFHKLKNLRSQIHYSRPDTESENRIEELVAARTHLQTLIQEAKDNQTDLVIQSTINISFLANAPVKELCLAEEVY